MKHSSRKAKYKELLIFLCTHQTFHWSISTAVLSIEIVICLLLKKLPGIKPCKKPNRFSCFIATSCFSMFHRVSELYSEISAWVCIWVCQRICTHTNIYYIYIYINNISIICIYIYRDHLLSPVPGTIGRLVHTSSKSTILPLNSAAAVCFHHSPPCIHLSTSLSSNSSSQLLSSAKNYWQSFVIYGYFG